MYTKQLLGWKAWYKDDKIYKSSKHQWKNLPKNGILGLKKFFHLVDVDGKKKVDEESGKDIYYEIIAGHRVVALDQEELLSYKRLPKCLKVGEKLTQEECQIICNEIDQDQEEPFEIEELVHDNG
jgi:Ca2+-binding EF-hand superfamily protein